MFEKPASTEVPIAALLARRWSGQAFDPDRPVPREVLLALCEAARWRLRVTAMSRGVS